LCAAVLAAGVVLLAPGTASAAAGGRTVLTPDRHVRFGFGAVAPGQSATQVFTISTGRWARWSGLVFVHLSNSSDFSLVSDGCKGTLLTPAAPSCQVSVAFAPTAAGTRREYVLLSVFGTRSPTRSWFTPRARFYSTDLLRGYPGSGGGTTGGTGPASLQLSPGTASGSNAYGYSFGQVGVASQSFTLTNVGGQDSLALALNGWTAGGYSLSDDTCTGATLSPGASCTFSETWTSADDPLCDGFGESVSLSTTVDSADASTNYADVSLSAVCG
jgi:hypothetical protein